jgi:hypothetical protein
VWDRGKAGDNFKRLPIVTDIEMAVASAAAFLLLN